MKESGNIAPVLDDRALLEQLDSQFESDRLEPTQYGRQYHGELPGGWRVTSIPSPTKENPGKKYYGIELNGAVTLAQTGLHWTQLPETEFRSSALYMRYIEEDHKVVGGENG